MNFAMKLWKKILNEGQKACDLNYDLKAYRLVEGDEEADGIISEECPYYTKYEHLYYIILYMTDMQDELEKTYAYETIQEHLYDKWDLYYKPYLEDDPAQIDILIECAIDNQIPTEFLMFLIDWKYKYGVFEGKDWKL